MVHRLTWLDQAAGLDPVEHTAELSPEVTRCSPEGLLRQAVSRRLIMVYVSRITGCGWVNGWGRDL